MIKTFKIFEKFNSNFWKWFGNSKMIDEQGNPIVAYHGTNRKFDEFKNDVGHTNDLGFYGDGFYFTFGNGKYSKEEAGYYGNNIIEVYLKIENPFDFSKLLTYKNTEINIMGLNSMVFLYNVAKEFPELSNNIHIDKTIWNNDEGSVISVPISIIPKLVEKYKKKLKYTEGENNRGDKYKSGYVKSKTIKYDYSHVGGKIGSYVDFEELGQWSYKISDDELEIGLIMQAIEKYDGIEAEYHPEGYMTRNPEISEIIKKRGYDGIVQSMDGDEVVVFNPNQIKSVNNIGEYSLNSNNINESLDQDKLKGGELVSVYLSDGNYWQIKRDESYFKRQLDNVNCPESDIQILLSKLKDIMNNGIDMYSNSDEIYLIHGFKNQFKNPEIYDEYHLKYGVWDIQERYFDTYSLDEFEYCGKVFLTKQQYKDIEIEKKAKNII